jgi:hypothetical protein
VLQSLISVPQTATLEVQMGTQTVLSLCSKFLMTQLAMLIKVAVNVEVLLRYI